MRVVASGAKVKRRFIIPQCLMSGKKGQVEASARRFPRTSGQTPRILSRELGLYKIRSAGGTGSITIGSVTFDQLRGRS
jgi:hypothetical protein